MEPSNPFFDHPILYSPYEYPSRHWELDESGQPTQRIIDKRRRAEFITPIPKPKKRRGSADQQQIVFDEGKGLSTKAQQYDPTPIINELRQQVDQWRSLPSNLWQVTPETARLWSTGGTTTSADYAHSSAKWKPWKRQYG
jgi:type III restriction enzyme